MGLSKPHFFWFLCRFQCPQLPEYLKLVSKFPCLEKLWLWCLFPLLYSSPFVCSLFLLFPLSCVPLSAVPLSLSSPPLYPPSFPTSFSHSPPSLLVSVPSAVFSTLCCFRFPCLCVYALFPHLSAFCVSLRHSVIVSGLCDYSIYILGAWNDSITESYSGDFCQCGAGVLGSQIPSCQLQLTWAHSPSLDTSHSS